MGAILSMAWGRTMTSIKAGDIVEHRGFTKSEWSEPIWLVTAIYENYAWIRYKDNSPRTTYVTSLRKPAPKPVVEEVVMFGGQDHRDSWGFDVSQLNPCTHKITFNTVDGEPDCNSIKMEKLWGRSS